MLAFTIMAFSSVMSLSRKWLGDNFCHCLSLQSYFFGQAVISSDGPIHWLKHFNIVLHVPLNFFHQKSLSWSILGEDQLFHILTASRKSFWWLWFPHIRKFCPTSFETCVQRKKNKMRLLLFIGSWYNPCKC